MVFTTTTLFKAIACPYLENCQLTNCIFNHDPQPAASPLSQTPVIQPAGDQDARTKEPATKRRKIAHDSGAQHPPTKADKIRSDLATARAATSSINSPQANAEPSKPKTLTRPVSPPPSTSIASSKQPSNSAENLNPRLIANDPAGHAKRSLYLKHLHAEMVRLNQEVQDSQTLQDKQLLVLSEQELTQMALDEEEQLARERPLIYGNVVKQKIAVYKKMKMEDWTKKVQTSFRKPSAQDSTVDKDAKPIETDLTREEELLLLPTLVADQSRLASFGYIPNPPTEAEAAKAAEAVESSRNYEVCDRCSARFQVFPNRNEEGLLTSNGPCKHHPNRKVFPPKTKADLAMGTLKEAYYPCCDAVVGSPGCTSKEYHVFKASNPARLAAVLPFITTPENEEPSKDKHGKEVKAVTFDCEMGYTVYGLELIRLTAVPWPSGEELVDVLVRPLGTIIDFNSRFSGVWPEHFTNAIPFKEWASTSSSLSSTPVINGGTASPLLPIVNSPKEARSLLCSFLKPTTPLIGHAIDNDLNAVRLCHPTIVDTVLLFPHPRGLPMRFGLKMLASRYLGRSIQTGGDRGHDSLEDAVATGDLVRVKVGEKWKPLRATGWKFVDGELIAPDGTTRDVKEMSAKVDKRAPSAGSKRRKKWAGISGDGTAEESTEDEAVSPANGVAADLNKS